MFYRLEVIIFAALRRPGAILPDKYSSRNHIVSFCYSLALAVDIGNKSVPAVPSTQFVFANPESWVGLYDGKAMENRRTFKLKAKVP